MKQTFEQFLMEKHAESFTGTKDCMVDDFSNWLFQLATEDYIHYGDLFAKKKSQNLLEACKEAKRMYDEVQPVGGWQGVDDLLIHAIAEAEGSF